MLQTPKSKLLNLQRHLNCYLLITPSKRLLVNETEGNVGRRDKRHDLQVDPSLKGTRFLVRLGSRLLLQVRVDGSGECHLLGCRGMARHLFNLVPGGLRLIRQLPFFLLSLSLEWNKVGIYRGNSR